MFDLFRRRITETMRRRRHVASLSKLSDSQLNDIGLTRHDVSRLTGHRP